MASAYVVRYLIGGEKCEKLFSERWQAEAFRDGCDDNHKAIVVPLVEEADLVSYEVAPQPAAYVTIANALDMNAVEFNAGRIDKATWKANSDALWAEASRQRLTFDVTRIVLGRF